MEQFRAGLDAERQNVLLGNLKSMAQLDIRIRALWNRTRDSFQGYMKDTNLTEICLAQARFAAAKMRNTVESNLTEIVAAEIYAITYLWF
jgi:hypothetical protein